MSDNNGGFWSGFAGGLLGTSDEENDKLRQQYGLLGVEPPSAVARIGRGATDVWEPLKQMYLNAYQPNQASAYQAQRQEDERLYQRGLLSANPRPSNSAAPSPPDLWRQAGRGAAVTPLLLPGIMSLPATAPEVAMSLLLSSNLYEALDAARKRLGLFPEFDK